MDEVSEAYRIGIDLGGTKIEGVVFHGNEELLRRRIATEADRGYAHILERVCGIHRMLAAQIDDQPHTLGIGTPGAISHRDLKLTNCNIVCMNGETIKADLESLLGRRISIENDANCFALAEARLGAGKSFRTVFGAVLGTGCGAGIVVDQTLLTGAYGLAGEWGHMSIDRNGIDCFCGRKGCVERYVSGSGLEALYFGHSSRRASVEDIIENYRKHAPLERRLVEQFLDDVSWSLANVISVLDPDVIVIGGGLAGIPELFRYLPGKIREILDRRAYEPVIRENRLGPSAGTIGAALIGI